MNDEAMARGDAAFAAGEWRTAAKEYLLAAGSGGPGSGEPLHKAGNALMRLKRFDDAISVYERALEDPTYGRRTALAYNLGVACAAAGDHQRAVEWFERVLDDATYPARYKAYQASGGALAALGRREEAVEAYRRASLEADNPYPGKALNNLGLVLMELERYAEAIEAFRAALALDAYEGKGKVAVNLGLCYEALGRHSDAVRAFERATEEFGHVLNEVALQAYDRARAALADAKPTIVEGWRTGEMPPVFGVPDDEELASSAFFTRTEEEMRAADREARRAAKVAKRAERSLAARLGTWLAIALVILGFAGFAWFNGLGYPTQRMTVSGLLDAYREGEPVDGFWVAVPTTDVEKEMSNLPPTFKDYQITSIDHSAKTSAVDVTIVLQQGAPLTYRISLVREGVGWKVNGVTNDWRSTSGDS